ncbi:MAG: hypothetical protein OSA21_05440, partial [Candidatus Poseidoniaceae archaeon]|nr:hypothetical protein [Candidatus Poseidoniaceae archaeon]
MLSPTERIRSPFKFFRAGGDENICEQPCTQKGVRFGGDMRLTGTVSSGLGRAHIFMAQTH